MTYRELERNAHNQLEHAGIYAGFSRVLLLELCQMQNRDLYALMDEPVDEDFTQQYLICLEGLLNHKPLAYVLGYEWFYGYQFKVNEDVLIPRQETEELVGHILSDCDERYHDPVICDIGCGSGAIAITLAKELNLRTYASDISPKALAVAKENAKCLEADLVFLEGDMLEPFIKEKIMVDVLVCNPPYIKKTEKIAKSVLDYEPHVALFGGTDGMHFYRIVLDSAHKILKAKGMIAFEIGFDLGDEITTYAKERFPQAEIVLKQDINGLDRMVFIYT